MDDMCILRCGRILPMEISLPSGYQIEPEEDRSVIAFTADGTVIGKVQISSTTLGGETVRTLAELSVVGAHRRKGIGTTLCKAAMVLLRREDNAAPVYVQVAPGNDIALHLFGKLGFAPLPEKPVFDPACMKWDVRGLVPAIAQDAYTGEVLMQAYMNAESLQMTLDSGYATYFSRSRNELWRKGATSGHLQRVIRLSYDCDADSILLQVDQTGPACHTGKRSCFFNPVVEGDMPATSAILDAIEQTVADRAANPRPGSYTNYLLDKGAEKIGKKVGEEATEAVIAAIKGDADGLAGEAADLLYHLVVLLYQQGVPLRDVWEVLKKRHS